MLKKSAGNPYLNICDFGPWAEKAFLIGAVVVLFSTLLAALAAWTRLFSDAFGRFGWINFNDEKQRRKSIAILSVIFPIIWSKARVRDRRPCGAGRAAT